MGAKCSIQKPAVQASSSDNLNKAVGYLNNIKNAIKQNVIEPILRTFSNPTKEDIIYTAALGTGLLGIGLIMTPVAVPLAANAAGFGSGGVVAGSAAARIMASYNGFVPVVSICASLQSVGAIGFIGSPVAIGFIVAGSICLAISAILFLIYLSRREKALPDCG